MDYHIFASLHADVRSALTHSDLLGALTATEGMLTAVTRWEDVQQVQDIRHSYQQMLQYLRQGTEDPERIALHQDFLRQLLLIAERTRYQYEMLYGNLPIHQTFRRLKGGHIASSMTSAALSWNQRFDRIWTSAQWGEEELQELLTFITTPQAPIEERAMAVSATMLSALQYFDPQKMSMLILLSRCCERSIRLRAQLSLILCVFIHEKYIKLFPTLGEDIRALISDEDVARQMRRFFRDIITASMAEDVSQKFSNELQGLSNISDPDAFKQQLEGKFKVFIDLQSAGTDLNIETFKVMSRQTPFFNPVAHWFCPFTPAHPEAVDIEMPRALEAMFRLGRHTDTDKYAFLMLLRGRNVQFQQDSEEPIPEELLASEVSDDKERELLQIRHLVFDHYRYFTLKVRNNQEANPFTTDDDILSHKFLSSLFCAEENLRRIIMQLIRAKRYSEAIPALQGIISQQPHHLWALKRLGECYYLEDNYHEAANAFSQAIQQAPDDDDLQLRYAICLVELHQESEALPLLYKLHYHDENNLTVRRFLARCLLIEGETSLACDHYHILTTSSEVKALDFFNFGHIFLLQNDLTSAMALYEQYLNLCSDKSGTLQHFFSADEEWLHSCGVSPSTLALISDALKG